MAASYYAAVERVQFSRWKLKKSPDPSFRSVFFFFFLIGSELWTGVESNKFGCCGMTTKGAASEVWEWVFAVQNRLAELLHLTLTGAFSNAARKESHGQ